MVRRITLLAVLVAPLVTAAGSTACGSRAARPPAPPAARPDVDPEGPHRAAIAAFVQPYLDAELVNGLVVGIYDAGRREIYGFGKGPGGASPNGGTLFELGAITKIYTGLLLADAIQRREVELDTPVAEFLPPGVSVPTADKVEITLRHLALDSSGLPSLPPSVAAASSADPFGGYDEDALYRDLARTRLVGAPGTRIVYSSYGAGLLAHALGKKIGTGYQKAVEARILKPLELHDTFFTVPAAAAARRVLGTDDDLASVKSWRWDALAGAGGLISSVRDQLKLLEAELDAAEGGKTLPLRHPLRLTQEAQLEPRSPDNAGLGWMIDSEGRYWHTGGTAGFRSFIAFDAKIKRGVVVLAGTSSPLIDRLGHTLLVMSAEAPPKNWTPPTGAQLASYAGTYDLAGSPLAIVHQGKRLYLAADNEPRVRLAPVSATTFWIEPLKAMATFQQEGDKIARLVFEVGTRQIIAPRVEPGAAAAPPAPEPAPAPAPAKPAPTKPAPTKP